MNARRSALTAWFALVGALAAWSPSSDLEAAQSVHLAIVVAKNSPLTELSSSELRRLYLGQAVHGPDDKKLVPLAPDPTNKDRIGFEQTVTGLSPDRAARYWIDRKIRGQSGPPKTVEPPQVMMRFIAKLDSTVGYVKASDVIADVKIVRIDGKAPGDPGYPVQY